MKTLRLFSIGLLCFFVTTLVEADPTEPIQRPLPPGYHWVSCSDPAHSGTLGCDGDPPPLGMSVSQEQWEALQDTRRCARLIAQCERKPISKRAPCLANIEAHC